MTQVSLNSATERQFIIDIACILQRGDLSKLDLRTHSDDVSQHRTHSILFDNYEICIGRTPVYASLTVPQRIFNTGQWCLHGGIYERYEIMVSENRYNARFSEFPGPRLLSCRHNVLMHHGTMASDYGYYRYEPYQARGLASDSVRDLYLCANKHLFEPCKDLFMLLDIEYRRRKFDLRERDIYRAKSSHDIADTCNKVLEIAEQQLQKSK